MATSSSSLPLVNESGTGAVGSVLPLSLAPQSSDSIGPESAQRGLATQLAADPTISHRLSAVVPEQISGATVQGLTSLPALPLRSKGARVPLIDLAGPLDKGSVPEPLLDRSRSPRGPERFDLSPRSLHAPVAGDLPDDTTIDLSANLSMILDESAVRHGRALEERRTM